MTVDERRVLEDGRDRLRGVVGIIGPDGQNPISPLARRAENPALWTGNWQANAVGFLQATEWWVGKPLADSVEAIVGWLDRRIAQLDDEARAVAAGTAMSCPAPPSMPREGPGPPPGAPKSWNGGRGFSSMDPAQVKRLCRDMESTADAVARLGRTVRTALQDMAAFLPGHAAEAVGLNRFDEVCNVLREVGRDLSNRATRMEEAYAVSAFFGAPLPLLGLVRAAAAPQPIKAMAAGPAPAPTVGPPRPAPAVAGSSRPPREASRSQWSGFFLGRMTRDGLDRDERRRALRVLKAACGRGKNNPASAAEFVNGLGSDALGVLVGTDDEIRKKLGCVLGAASSAGGMKFDAKAVLLRAGQRLHPTDMMEVFEAGRFDPSWVIGFAEQFFAIPAPRPTKYYFDMVERTVRLLGRDKATAFAAATDPGIARSLGGLINHTDKGVRRAAEAAARKGLLPPPDNHDQLVAARNGMEAIILRACEHPRPTGSARRLVADFLAFNMGDLAILATKGDEGRLSPDELSLRRKDYEKALVFACKEAAGRAAVLASSTARLAAVAGSGANVIARGLTPGAGLEEIKALARSAASTMNAPLRELGAHLGLLGKVNLEVLDDRKRAAKEIATAIGVIGSVLLAGGGMAAGAAGGALKAANTLGGPVASEVVTQLTEALEKRLVADDVKTAADFMDVINSTVETVMVVGLYNQTEPNGRHPFRDRMRSLGMQDPPAQFLDGDGHMVLPVPLTPEAQGQLDDWLKPSVEGPNPSNPLYEVSRAWVHADDGLSETWQETLVRALYDREAKE